MSRQKTALVSVYEKTNPDIAEFARALVELDWKIISSGGTAKYLNERGLLVQDVAELVGGGAILGHRVVTLSREVHAGLLARDGEEDQAELDRLGIPRIDLVCCDFYPMREAINRPGATIDSVVEMTDIGGPTMARSAAKGGRIVICDPADRESVITYLREDGDVSDKVRQYLRAKAEFIVAGYCLESARFHGKDSFDGILGERIDTAAYGENRWQAPALVYSTSRFGHSDYFALEDFRVVAGATPSFNNRIDVERLLQTITHIAAGWVKNRRVIPLIAVGGKHGNPCGAAVAHDSATAIQKMIMGDPRAIFGGLVMVNFPIDEEDAEILHTHGLASGRRLYDGIIAPEFAPEAIDLLSRKKDKCRFIANPALVDLSWIGLDASRRIRPVRGGFLTQPNYTFVLDFSNSEMKVFGTRDPAIEDDLVLAWAVGSTSNSNTITIVKDGQLIGNGVGGQDRVGAAGKAIEICRTGRHDLAGAVAYSDSFFPFEDAVLLLAAYGIRAIFSTSGSVRDEKIQQVCQAAGVTLYQLPDGLARGFFGH